MRKLPSILQEDEVLKLFSMVYDPKHKMQLKLMYYCGLRVSEMLNLKKSDINFKEEVLKVVQGKGGKDRLIPIPKPLQMELKSYLLQPFMDNEQRLFKTTSRATQYMLERVSKKFGKKVNPHMLRHSYATHVLEQTNNLELVRDLLGHSDIRITQIYTHMTTKAKKAGINEVWK
jgi:integrase/recombinase XerD